MLHPISSATLTIACVKALHIQMLFDSALNEYQKMHRIAIFTMRARCSAAWASGSQVLDALSDP